MKPSAGKRPSSKGSRVFLVRGKDAGKPAWHYVLVDTLKQPLFIKALKGGTLELRDYGTVLHSGWGAEPPPELAEAMRKQYS